MVERGGSIPSPGTRNENDKGAHVKTIITIITGAVLAACGHTAPDLPPCQVEDQLRPSCRWDATTQGNGLGTSFTVTWNESRQQAFIQWDNGASEWTSDGSVLP
jgi:hypothetical protein